MSLSTEVPSLAALPAISYLDANGALPSELAGKIGVYAIYDRAGTLQLIDYSRDMSFGLLQHLVRQPEKCYGVKAHTIARPSRAILEAIRQAWLAEQETIPAGNGVDADLWQKPIDVRGALTPEEEAAFAAAEELGRAKILKQVARRCQADKLEQLKARGLEGGVRFNPKLKEKGLLDLNPVKR
ncbi:MAG: GIY-YIG nuclease family protein [Cyanobacteria bacterium J06641_5]